MSYLNFDKTLLTNLEKSLSKEIIRTNRAGTYSSTTLVGCNTRKYHGQLVVPIPHFNNSNHVLLSSLDETVIQHGAEFNLGIHRYENNNFNPGGHKYIREFTCDTIPRTLYRVGGVLLSKEIVLVSFESRVLIKYTLIDAHSPTTLRFKPFLAFRDTNMLMRQNTNANTSFEPIENGISMQLYHGYPTLCMQFSKQNEYIHSPDWYNGIEYYKEQERGYDYKEDLLVSGYFELPIKKGESIIFSAGVSETSTNSLKRLWNKEVKRRSPRTNMFENLKNAAEQCYKREGENTYLLAGYPWFTARARDQFIALAGCTLKIGRMDYFDDISKTAVKEIEQFLSGNGNNCKLEGIADPDVLLWFIATVQHYAKHTDIEQATTRFGDTVANIVNYIRGGKHNNLFVHQNGLLYLDGTAKPATWMNAVEEGNPITPRTGYVVETNALWYNALKFSVEIETQRKNQQIAALLDYQAEIAKDSFNELFWNGSYLYDYVIGDYKDKEVRPNMVIAAGLPHSPIDRAKQKSIMAIATRELLTPKGLRTLSPKSGSYRPEYMGGMKERDWNYHNGPIWVWTIGYFADAYLKIYKESGVRFLDRIMIGLEAELSELCVGSISELYDGNPPYKGHGGMSFAVNIGEVLRVLETIDTYKKAQPNSYHLAGYSV